MILVHVVYIGCHGHRIHWRNQPGWLFGDEYVEMYDIFRRPFCSICNRFGSVSLCTVYADSHVPENWHRWIFMGSDQIIASSPCQSLWLPLHVNPLDGHVHIPYISSCCPNNINCYTIPCNFHSFIWWKGIPDSTWYYILRHDFGPHCYIMQWYWYYDGSDSTWYCIWDPRYHMILYMGSQIAHDIVYGDTISDHIAILCNGIDIMTAHIGIDIMTAHIGLVVWLKFITDPGDNPLLFSKYYNGSFRYT